MTIATTQAPLADLRESRMFYAPWLGFSKDGIDGNGFRWETQEEPEEDGRRR
jgi:hypothetical protein